MRAILQFVYFVHCTIIYSMILSHTRKKQGEDKDEDNNEEAKKCSVCLRPYAITYSDNVKMRWHIFIAVAGKITL